MLMWLGELVTQRGIGNGMSLLIFASIMTSAGTAVNAWLNGGTLERLALPIITIGILVSVVFVNEGQRRIPIQYAKRMVGRRMTSGGSTYMPLRVNMAGVIPVIFAVAVLFFPPTVGQLFPSSAAHSFARFMAPGGWPADDLRVRPRDRASRSSTPRSRSTRSTRRTTSRRTAASSRACVRVGRRRTTSTACSRG